MQPVAAWLVARPERAVFALIATFMLPITQILGSALLVLLVLSRGLTHTLVVAGFGLAAVGVLGLVSDVPLTQVFQVGLTIWLPAIVLALLLRRMRSLTLLLQTTVLIALAGIVGMYVALGDPATHWHGVLEGLAEAWRAAGYDREAELFLELLPYAPYMTGIFVSIGWLMHVVALLAGYAASLSLEGQSDGFGRFSDLNFGRVLAVVLALVSAVAMISAAAWLQNFAFVLFVIFWLQGMALLHWLRRYRRMPGLALVAVYALTAALGPLLVTVVGVMGYTDAWFNYRPRIAKI